MLIQNRYDGRLYEVPDQAGYGEYAGPAYHGLGIPAFLAPLAAKIGAKLLPKALPVLKRLPIVGDLFGEVPWRFRRFGRFPFRRGLRFRRGLFRPGVPFRPGLPVPGGVAPVFRPLLSTNIARKVVAMMRQQGLQVMPAGPPPGPPEPEPSGPPPGAAPGGPPPEPQPGVAGYPGYAEYPYDPQSMESEDYDPYADPYAQQDPYANQQPYQYPPAYISPWRRRWSQWWSRRRYPGTWSRNRSFYRPVQWRGAAAGRWRQPAVAVRRPQIAVRRATPPVPPASRRR